MSASIQTSLKKLNASVYKLEAALEAKKAAPSRKSANAQSADLFGALTASQQNPSNLNPVNVKMLATRLDTAINKVEQILKEGRG